MRIIVLGDFHLDRNELDLTARAMEDLNAAGPDLVVPLGDFGCNASIGGVEGLEQAYLFLSKLNAPLRPILGNHDLQRETGNVGIQPRGTMEKAFLRMFGLERTKGVLEFDSFRLFFAGTDLQPGDSCYMEQECYMTDDHFREIENKLQERPGVPCLFFTHAPPTGAGLRTVPKVHVRATNAYLDQNHHYERWMELVRQYPQIIMWFSAHYHLGHDYPDSTTTRYGTTFFISGVHGSCTRDGCRQSRVIDIEEGAIRVHTLDHVVRRIRETPDWQGILKVKPPELLDRSQREPAVTYFCGPFNRTSAYPIGTEKVIRRGLVPIDGFRCLAATEDGFLWEHLLTYEAIMGTLHLGPKLAAVTVAEDGVWRAWDHKLVRSDPDSLWRFQRRKPEAAYAEMLEWDKPIHSMAPRAGGGVWAACRDELWSAEFPQGAKLIFSFGQNIRELISDGSTVFVLLEDGGLLRFDGETFERVLVPSRERVLGWDAWRGATAGLILGIDEGRQGEVNVVYTMASREESQCRLQLSADSIALLEANSPSAQILLLDTGLVLIHLGVTAYMWDVREVEPKHRITMERPVHAIARMASDDEAVVRFCLCADGEGVDARPELQVWEFRK